MNKQPFDFLKNYSSDTYKIDRILVSSFQLLNNLTIRNNIFLQSYIIRETDEDLDNLKEFITLMTEMTFENLIEIFEFVISPAEKLITGAVYTPKNIRDYIVSETLERFIQLEDLKICDPACGCSGFLYSAAIEIHMKTGKKFKEIFEQNLYGNDIQSFSITRSRILLSLLAISVGEDEQKFEFNLFCGNSLSFDWSAIIPYYKGFQLVLGNPPYVSSKNIDPESKLFLQKWSASSTGHPDLYIPFFQIGIENLAENGVLGFITMNTFFKSVNGRAIREYLVNNSWDLMILDFGGHQVFKSRNTYTCIFILQKRLSHYILYEKWDNPQLNQVPIPYPVSYELLKNQVGWNLSNYTLLQKIEKTGKPFGDIYKTRNGIATLKNEVYIFSPINEDSNHYFFQKNGRIIAVERGICKDIVNPNKLTRLEGIGTIRRKVIFPYNYTCEGVAIIIPEQKLLKKFPLTYAYLNDNKEVLAGRDKGEGNYEAWYAFGRRQSFEKIPYKLFFPHIAPSTPFFVLNDEPDLLFHNGLAIVSDNREELLIAEKILKSRLFWFYIENGSKPYSSGYFSLSRNYIKNFGVYSFNAEQRAFILKENSLEVLNSFFEELYDVILPN